jgi:hypothetical protein
MADAASDNGIGTVTNRPRRQVWTDWYSFAVDATQRSILFWDTIASWQQLCTTRRRTSAVLHLLLRNGGDGHKFSVPSVPLRAHRSTEGA